MSRLEPLTETIREAGFAFVPGRRHARRCWSRPAR